MIKELVCWVFEKIFLVNSVLTVYVKHLVVAGWISTAGLPRVS